MARRLQLRRGGDVDHGRAVGHGDIWIDHRSGFSDAWQAKHPSDPGFTCCQATDLLNPTSTLTERVDLVLTRGPFHVAKASLVGDEASDRLPSGLWPSDHAGVVVTLELESDG